MRTKNPVGKETKSYEAARCALRIIWMLQGHAFEGLRLKPIAEGIRASMPNALRYMEMLADEGVTERIPGREECWRLTPKLIQLSRAHEQEMSRLRNKVDEIDQRYTREPK